MGVDLGIKCPAVSYCPDGSVKFYGNGRKNKYIRRHYNNLRKRFKKAKKPKAVVKINNKEPVSYTHLDVYKRQLFFNINYSIKRKI